MLYNDNIHIDERDENMNDMILTKRKQLFVIITTVTIFITLLLIEFLDIQFFNDVLISSMFTDIIIRFLGGTLFLVIIIGYGYQYYKPKSKPFLKPFLIVLPALAISIYNFPFIAYFSGNAVVTEPLETVYMFALECLSVGFFEEVLFRGFLLVILLQVLPKTKRGIIGAIVLSSMIFGLIHLLNLFSGANFFNTIMQVGYSFLTGALWSVVFLKTKNIWIGVVFHAVYNFSGLLFFRFGNIINSADIITIITTIILSISVAIYMVRIIMNITTEEISELYTDKKTY